jgi:hypothetical protein
MDGISHQYTFCIYLLLLLLLRGLIPRENYSIRKFYRSKTLHSVGEEWKQATCWNTGVIDSWKEVSNSTQLKWSKHKTLSLERTWEANFPPNTSVHTIRFVRNINLYLCYFSISFCGKFPRMQFLSSFNLSQTFVLSCLQQSMQAA